MDYSKTTENLNIDVAEYGQGSTASTYNFIIPITTLNNIDNNIDLIRKDVSSLLIRENTYLNSLNSDKYSLRYPISVALSYEDNFYTAELYELQLYGNGTEKLEALDDLKANLTELYEELVDMDESKLGAPMVNYKKYLIDIILKNENL